MFYNVLQKAQYVILLQKAVCELIYYMYVIHCSSSTIVNVTLRNDKIIIYYVTTYLQFLFTHAHSLNNLGKMVGHPKIQGANGDIDFRPSQK